jgi:hypothetical protein
MAIASPVPASPGPRPTSSVALITVAIRRRIGLTSSMRRVTTDGVTPMA